MAKDVFARIEMKFLLNEIQYHAMRSGLTGIAHVDEYGETTICNIYYDTPSWHLIRTSLEKPSYKEKLRLRAYGVPDADSRCFIEMKKKFQKVVYKRRVEMPYALAVRYLAEKGRRRPAEQIASDREGDAERFGITSALEKQILKEINYFTSRYELLQPAMAIAYDRIAMTGDDDPELRITFDRNIRWRNTEPDLTRGAEGKQTLPEGYRLMELKIAGGIPMHIVKMLSRLEIRPLSFSKYGRSYEQMMETAAKDKGQRKVLILPQRGAVTAQKAAMA